tara:strand:+ start:387 stop:560 length:174 start_codon:yes stop_codon:yes gene_type:complete
MKQIKKSCPQAFARINSLINLVNDSASHTIMSSMIAYSELTLPDRMKLRKKLHAIKW